MKNKIQIDRAVWFVLLAWIGGAVSFYLHPTLAAAGAGIILLVFIVVIFTITE